MPSTTILILGYPPETYAEVSKPWIQRLGREIELSFIAVEGIDEAVAALQRHQRVDIIFFGNTKNRTREMCLEWAHRLCAVMQLRTTCPAVLFEEPSARIVTAPVFRAYGTPHFIYTVPEYFWSLV